MARYCDMFACDDTNEPSSINRQYSYSVGCMFPPYYGIQSLAKYSNDTVSEKDGHSLDISPEVFEWRCINRMMSYFQPAYVYTELTDTNFMILQRASGIFKKLRRSLHGIRYTIAGPSYLLTEPDRDEDDNWEVYEFISPEKDLVSVFFYRCYSEQKHFHVNLKGLDPSASYEAEFHSGRSKGIYTGYQLMNNGIDMELERTKSADILVLNKIR